MVLRALGAWTGLVAGDAAAHWRHVSSFHVAGVALSDIPSFCVAGVALGDIHHRFAWQAWYLGHWAGSGGALGPD